MRRIDKAVWGLFICVLVFGEVHAQADTAIFVGSDRVVVSGVTPNGEVIVFGRSVVYGGGVPVMTRHALTIRDDDGDGVVTAAVEELPRYSTWVAVDAESGSFAVGPRVRQRA